MRLPALLLVAVTLPCGAAVTVRVTGADDAANISVTAVNGADPSKKVTATPVAGEVRLELAPRQVWYVRAHARGYWNGEQAVYVTGDEQTLEALLRPGGNITAALQNVPNGVRRVHVRFAAAGGAEPRGDMNCVLEQARFICPVPAGRLDLSVGVRGTAYAYRWDVEVPAAGHVDLGTIALVPGGSVVGIVDTSRVRSKPAAFEVILRAGHGEAEVARTRPAPNGFFQFTGVASGEYVVALASRKGIADVRRDVVAQGAAEARLVRPLIADVARKLDGTVAPPVTADGHAWRVELWDRALRIEPSARAVATPAGAFSLRSLAPGTYDLFLRDPHGNTWLEQPVTIGERDGPPLHLSASALRVEGTVRAGATPLTGTLLFGGRYGTPRVELQARSGFFRGVVPAARSSWDVTVEGQEPQLERTLNNIRLVPRDGGVAYVDLQLPGGVVEGRVVDEEGTPVKKAIVTIEKEGGELVSQTNTADDGTFRVAAVEDGAYLISAQSARGESERTEVTVEEGRGGPTRVVVRNVQWLRGTLRSRRGAVPGAVITAFSEEDPSYGAAAVETDGSGRFVARLPQGTRTTQLFVAAPGYGCTMQRLAIDGKPLALFVDDTGTELTLRYPAGAAVELRTAGSWIHPEFWLRDCPGALKEGRETTTLRLPRLAPGEYSLCEKGRRCVSAVLVPGGSAALDLTTP